MRISRRGDILNAGPEVFRGFSWRFSCFGQPSSPVRPSTVQKTRASLNGIMSITRLYCITCLF